MMYLTPFPMGFYQQSGLLQRIPYDNPQSCKIKVLVIIEAKTTFTDVFLSLAVGLMVSHGTDVTTVNFT